MMMYAIALVLLQALAIQANVFSDKPGNDIEALCAGKSTDLTSFSQLKELAAAAGSSACTPNTKEAITNLVTLIEQGKVDLCASESIDKLKLYYYRYLDSSDDESSNKEKLPKPLKRFALAYGMQMSNLCKKNMVKVLTEEGHQLLTPEDFAQLEKLTSDEGPVAQVLGAMGGPDEVFMPGDLAPFLKKHGLEAKEIGSDKLFLQMATSSYITKLQQVCQNRFKPIYDPLMIPLVRLSNVGFNYKDELLKEDLKSAQVVKEVGQWSRIVFLCESLNNLHVVEAPDADKELTQGTGARLMRIITKEEAAAIEGPAASATTEVDGEMFEFSPKVLVTLGDVIYDRADKKLVKAVKYFRTSRSEEDIIRTRMMNKGKALIKNQLKKGHIGLLISSTYKGLLRKHKNKEIVSPSESLVKTLDEIVEQTQAGGSQDLAVSYDGMMTTGERIIMELIMTAVIIGIIGTIVCIILVLAGVIG